MKKYFQITVLLFCIACQTKKSIIEENVFIDVSVYEDNGEKRASAMPALKSESELTKYKRRFEYLLMNISEMHQPQATKTRTEIWNLYPDTTKLKQVYLEKFINDKKLVNYFEEMYAPISNTNIEITKTYTTEELMDVASKFFYCDEVFPDTVIQSHVCIGINGIKEVKWEKDYTILSAFCFEAIFNDMDKDPSQVREAYHDEKKISCDKFKSTITTLDKYLEDVKMDLFNSMKNNEILKKELWVYY